MAAGGTLAFANWSTLHLRGAGQLLNLQGRLDAIAPLRGVVAYEATGSAPVLVAGGAYGWCQLQLVSRTAAAARFAQQGDITAIDSFLTDGTVAGANLIWQTNGHDLASSSWISVGDWGLSACGTTVQAGASAISAPYLVWFTSAHDVLQLGSSRWSAGSWGVWRASAVVEPGSSTVSVALAAGVPWATVAQRFWNLVVTGPCAAFGTLTIGNDGAVLAGGSLASLGNALHVGRDLAVAAGGSLQASTSAITVGRNLTLPAVDGAFVAGTSSVTLLGPGTLSDPDQANAFYDLRLATHGATVLLGTDATTTHRCTVLGGTVDFHNGAGAVLHLRGQGQVLAMHGTLWGGFPHGGAIEYDGTAANSSAAAAMRVEGIPYGWCSLRLYALGGAAAQFTQAGDITAIDDALTWGDAAGGSVQWTTNSHALTSSSWLSIGDWGASPAPTRLIAGGSRITVPGIAWFTNAHDDIELGTSRWTVGTWGAWSPLATIAPGRSQVTVTAGPVGVPWLPMPQAFYDLAIASSGGAAAVVPVEGPLTVLDALSVASGTLQVGAATVDGAVAVAPGQSLAAGSLTLAGSGAQSCTLSPSSTVGALDILGGARRVRLSGCTLGSWTVGAGTTVAVTAGQAITLSGGLTLLGSAAAPITLESSTVGAPWLLTLAPAVVEQLDAVRARDSDASHGKAIDDRDAGVNLGGDANWLFPGAAQPPTFTLQSTPVIAQENAPAQTVAGYAASIQPGGPGLTVSFQVAANPTSLFSVQPAISPSGTLTFTPAANASGAATLSVVAVNSAGLRSATQAGAIQIQATPPPSFILQAAPVSVLENAPSQSVASFATNIQPGAAGDTVSFRVSTDSSGLFSAQPAISPAGTLTFTPAANAFGTAIITVVALDSGGSASAAQTGTIQVLFVNQPPSFTLQAAPVTVLENAPAQSVSGFAAGIQPGAPGLSVSFRVTASDPALFNAQPAISPNGTLTFTPAANAFGSATLTVVAQNNGGIANGGVDTSAAQTGTIQVLFVNEPPSFTLQAAPVTVLENAPAQSVSGFAASIQPGVAGETVAFQVATSDASLFSVAPAITPSGTLTFTPAANAFGSATLTVVAQNNGGTANGGVDTSAPQTGTIQVLFVNQPPSFTLQPGPVMVPENAASQTVMSYASNIQPGAPGLAVSFQVTSSNPALFSVQPAISPIGTLTFTPAANTVGSATLTVVAQNNGGTANGGVDTSAAQAGTIQVQGAGGPPSFTLQTATVGVLENAPAQSLANYASNIQAGGPGLTVTFQVSTSNASLFSVPPAISPSGTLTFTPAANAFGSATLTVVAQNNGTGVTTSAAQTGGIQVLFVNQPPSFTAGPDETVAENSATLTVAGWATSISPGPADEAGQLVTFLVTTSNPGLFSTPPAVASNGTLTFTPAAGQTGFALVSVSAHDNGGTANGGVDTSAAQTFTIQVNASTSGFVNAPPVFTLGASPVVLENSGPQSIPGWATLVSPGPSPSEVVSFAVSCSNTSLFAVQPQVAANGTLTFTPATNASGAATIAITATNDGGIGNGGHDTSAAQSSSITVELVNHAPSFQLASYNPVYVLPSSGAVTMPGFLTNILPGPANESAQHVSFVVQVLPTPPTGGALGFDVPPSISPDGTLSFTVSPLSIGPVFATVMVTAVDDGGTANGGVDISQPQSFQIDLQQAPPGTGIQLLSQPLQVLENAPKQAIPPEIAPKLVPGAWAQFTNFSYVVSSSITDDNAALFLVPPMVDGNGNLVLQPGPNAVGTAHLAITLGGMVDEGQGNFMSVIMPTQYLTVQVVPVNQPPTFSIPPTVFTVLGAGPVTIPGWVTDISPGPANEASQTVSFQVTEAVVVVTPSTLFSVPPAISPQGTLTFTAAEVGTEDLEVIATDSGGTANGGSNTSFQHFSIAVLPADDVPAVTPPTAQPSPVTGTQCTLSEVATDNGSSDGLTYSWSATSPSTAKPVLFSVNGNASSATTIATFPASGTYACTVTVTNGISISVSSSVNVQVDQTPTSIVVSPAAVSAKVAVFGALGFTAALLDQFGAAMAAPSFTWSASPSGSIDGNGRFTAPGFATTCVITAAADGLVGTSSVSVENLPTPQFLPGSGTYLGQADVTLSTAMTGLSIYYTISSTGIPPDPTPGPPSLLYTGSPIGITADSTIKAISVASSGGSSHASQVASATYTIVPETALGPSSPPNTGYAPDGSGGVYVSPTTLTVPLLSSSSAVTASIGGSQVPVTVLGQSAVDIEAPLAPTGQPTTITITTTGDGASTQTATRTWLPIDLVSMGGGTIDIRAGDSLLLTCSSGGSGIELSMSPGGSSNAGPTFAIDQGQLQPIRFDIPGTYAIAAVGADGSSIGSYSVVVVGSPFTAQLIACEVKATRQVQIPAGSGYQQIVYTSADSSMMTVSGNGPLSITPLVQGYPLIAARLDNASGPIIALEPVTAFTLERCLKTRGLIEQSTTGPVENVSIVRLRPYVAGLSVQVQAKADAVSINLTVPSESMRQSWDAATGEMVGWFTFDPGYSISTTSWSGTIAAYQNPPDSTQQPLLVSDNTSFSPKIVKASLALTSPIAFPTYDQGDSLGYHFAAVQTALSLTIDSTDPSLFSELFLAGPSRSERYGAVQPYAPLLDSGGNPITSFADTIDAGYSLSLVYDLGTFDHVSGMLLDWGVAWNTQPTPPTIPRDNNVLLSISGENFTHQFWDEGEILSEWQSLYIPIPANGGGNPPPPPNYPMTFLGQVFDQNLGFPTDIVFDTWGTSAPDLFRTTWNPTGPTVLDVTSTVEITNFLESNESTHAGTLPLPASHLVFTEPGAYDLTGDFVPAPYPLPSPPPFSTQNTTYNGGTYPLGVFPVRFVCVVEGSDVNFFPPGANSSQPPSWPIAGGVTYIASDGSFVADVETSQPGGQSLTFDTDLIQPTVTAPPQPGPPALPQVVTSPYSIPVTPILAGGYDSTIGITLVYSGPPWDPTSGPLEPVGIPGPHGDGVPTGQYSGIQGFGLGPKSKDGVLLVTSDASKKTLQVLNLKPGLGAPTSTSATTTIIPGHAWVDLARSNVYFSTVIRRFNTPALGPDCILSYNSLDCIKTALGRGWRTNYDMRVYWPQNSSAIPTASGLIYLIDETGQRTRFQSTSLPPSNSLPTEVTFQALENTANAQIVRRTATTLDASGGWQAGERYRLVRHDNRWCFFDDLGRLVRITNLRGDTITVALDDHGFPSSASDQLGRKIDLSQGSFSNSGDPDHLDDVDYDESGSWSFGYDDRNNLTSITANSRGDSQFSGNDPTWSIAYTFPDNALETVNTITLPDQGTLITSIGALDTTTGKISVTEAFGGTASYIVAMSNKALVGGGVLTAMTDLAGVQHAWSYQVPTYQPNPVSGQAPLPVIDLTVFREPVKITVGSRSEERSYDLDGAIIHRRVHADPSPDLVEDQSFGSLVTTDLQDVPWPSETKLLLASTQRSVAGVNSSSGAADLTTSYVYATAQPGIGQLQSVTDPCGGTTVYTYDANGFLANVTDARGDVTTMVTTSTYGEVQDTLLPTGHHLTATYDMDGVDDGFVFSSTDVMGYTTTFTPDSFRRLAKRTDAALNPKGGGIPSTSYAYDPLGRVVKIDRNGADSMPDIVTTYGYDGEERQISELDPGMTAITTTYLSTSSVSGWTISTSGNKGFHEVVIDAAGRTLTDTVQRTLVGGSAAPTRCTTRNQYDTTDGWLNATSDPESNTTSFVHDLMGRVTKVTGPTQGVTATTYNSLGWVLSTTDPDGHVISASFDRCGRAISTTNPAGGATQLSYDAMGDVVAQVDGTSQGETFAYDADGYRIDQVDAFGVHRGSSYDASAKTYTETGPNQQSRVVQLELGGTVQAGAAGSFSTQGLERPSMVSASAGDVDPLVWVLQATDNRGSQTVYAPGRMPSGVVADSVGRPLKSFVTGTVGTASNRQIDTQFAYDQDLGFQTGRQGFFGLQQQSVVSTTGDVDQTQDNHNADDNGSLAATSTILRRDARGLVTQYSDGLGRRFTITYDGLGRMSTRTDPAQVVTTWTYSMQGAGNLLMQESVSGQPTGLNGGSGAPRQTTYTYDALGDITSVTNAAGQSTTTAFDAYGRRMQQTSRGVTTSFAYDPITGVLTQESRSDGQTTTYGHDGIGRLIQIADATGQKQTFSYDGMDRQTSSTGADQRTRTTTYDPNSGHVIMTTEAGAGTASGVGSRQTAYQYDGAGRLVQTTYDPSANATVATSGLDVWSGTSGARGEILTRSLSGPAGSGTITRQIDRGEQLRTLLLPGQSPVTFTYDNIGNQLSVGATAYTYNSLGQLSNIVDPSSSASLAYNGFDEVSSVSLFNGANGIAPILQQLFTYDPVGRLSALSQSLPSETEASSATRDAIGRLLSVTTANTNGDPSATTDYSYDSVGRLVAEHHVAATTSLHQYAYDLRGNRIADRVTENPVSVITNPTASISTTSSMVPLSGVNGVLLRLSTVVTTLPTASFGQTTQPTVVASVILGAGEGTSPGHYALNVVCQSMFGASLRWLELRWMPDNGPVGGVLVATSVDDNDTTGTLVINVLPGSPVGQQETSNIQAQMSSKSTGMPLTLLGPTSYAITGDVAFALGHGNTSVGGATFASIVAESADASQLLTTFSTFAPGDQLAATAAVQGGSTVGTSAYQYDAFGRLIQVQGTGSQAGTTTYGYDRLDRLIGCQGPSTSSQYAYYGESWMRATATENGALSSFTWDGRNMVSATFGGHSTAYCYLRNRPLWSSSSLDTVYYGQDMLGNVRGNIGQIPVGAANVWGYRTKYQYDAWGVAQQSNQIGTSLNSSGAQILTYGSVAIGTPWVPAGLTAGPAQAPGLTYKGEWRDASGLSYLRHRYMDPTLGRFTQADPSGAEANQFAYCGDDPVNRTDPMGTDWRWNQRGNGSWDWFWVPSTWGSDEFHISAPQGVSPPAFTPPKADWGRDVNGVTYIDYDHYPSVTAEGIEKARTIREGLANLQKAANISDSDWQHIVNEHPYAIPVIADSTYRNAVQMSTPWGVEEVRENARSTQNALLLGSVIAAPLDVAAMAEFSGAMAERGELSLSRSAAAIGEETAASTAARYASDANSISGIARLFGGENPVAAVEDIAAARSGTFDIPLTRSELRASTPNDIGRAYVQGSYVNPLTNLVVVTQERLAADHFIPVKWIINRPNFQLLTRQQQVALLNELSNLKGLTKSLNSSKGALMPGDWATYKGVPLDPAYIQQALADQTKMQELIDRLIDEMRTQTHGP